MVSGPESKPVDFPVCEVVPTIIDVAKEVEGFGKLKHREDQGAVLEFAEVYISFFDHLDRDQFRDEFFRGIHNLHNEILRSIAFSVALRARAALRQK